MRLATFQRDSVATNGFRLPKIGELIGGGGGGGSY